MATFPTRSPLVLAEALRPLYEGKVICELGACEGDLLQLFAQYAKEAIGVEIIPERHAKAIEKGLNVVLGDHTKDPIPEADVYYFWTNNLNARDVIPRLKKGLLILGEYYGEIDDIIALYRSYTIMIPHQEIGHSEALNHFFKITIIDLDGQPSGTN